MSFLGELKRRNVFRVAGVYAVVGWLLVQVAAALEEAVNLPDWFDGMVVSLLLIGFPLALVFAWAFELTPEGLKRTAAVSPEESITAQTGSKLDVVLIVALLVFGAGMFAPRLLERGAEPASAPAADSAAPAVREASIAVLPFADLSQDKDQEYFADGISEELLNVLAQVKGMKVAGRTSSFAFKGRNEDLREIGEVLGVAHILEGSVRSQGDKVRVTAQLIQASDGFHLWSQTYDRDLDDIFAVQDDIAQQILVAMKEHLVGDETPEFVPAARTDIAAYNLFLEARDLIFTRGPEEMTRALELLDRAIAIDPTYAPAYAARAKALTLLSDRPGSYGTVPAKEALTRSRADVEKALQLDPELADGHAVMGLINADTGRPDFAISSLRRALELNPNSLDARNWLALALSYNGRLRDVAEQLQTLVDIDPLYPPGVNNAINYHARIGDVDTIRRIGERYVNATTDEVERSKTQSSLLWHLERRYADSMRVMESVGIENLASGSRNTLRWSYLALGIVDDYRGAAEVLPAFRPWLPFLRGDVDAAVAAAERSIQEFPDFFVAHTQYIRILSQARRDEQLAAYFEREYGGDLETYATRLRPAVNVDPPPYGELALAMRSVGKQKMFDDAMQRWRFTNDIFRAGGDVSADRDLDDATYYAIMGDTRRALDFLEAAFGKESPLRISLFIDRGLDSLRDQIRFLVLREKNLQRINEERANLGYDPLTLDYYQLFEAPAQLASSD